MTIEAINDFEKLTKFPLSDFILDSQNFFKYSYPVLVNFYSGKLERIDKYHTELLNSLLLKANELTTQFKLQKRKLVTVELWELLDDIEVIKSKLQTSANLPKYLRSSITNSNFTKGIKYEYVLSDNQTIEDVSKQVLFSLNSENDWTQIALKNDLREIDWSIKGGTKLNLVDDSFISGIVTSMIDNTVGKKVYGLDIQKNIQFDSDLNDIVVLSYDETLNQTVNILSTLSKGDIPEFSSLGIPASIYKGANFNQIKYPSLIREFQKIFKTDDLFTDFSVTRLQYIDGDITLDYILGTKYEIVIEKQLTI